NDLFSITFTRMKYAVDITYHVFSSNDLTTWDEIWNSQSYPYRGGNSLSNRVTVSDTVSIAAAPFAQRYLRMGVSEL
ncbi:MAG: hypothetical protein JXR25_03350, partial [Pontiellaceae bacterium]|nr:hypothetical protein [Pontiellaceae bacterium]